MMSSHVLTHTSATRLPAACAAGAAAAVFFPFPAGRHKKRKSKEERLASVMAGREGREAFGSRTGIKKKKQGGLSEREKQRSKSMPIAARIQQLRNRGVKARNKSNPRHFKGHVRK
jgi:protein SDA1